MKALFGKIFLLMLISVSALAQTYPVTTPTYIPNPTLAATTYTTVGTTSEFMINGMSSLHVQLTGSPVGFTAVLEVTASRGTSPTWVAIPLDQADGDRLAIISAIGSYNANVSGFAKARMRIITMSSGSVTVTMSGGLGSRVVGTIPVDRKTYTAVVSGVVPAASATDFVTITGSSSYTVRITRVECSGQANTAANQYVQLVTRSTPASGGTATTAVSTTHDPADPAATAVVRAYTANPTVGTLTGAIRAGFLPLPISTVSDTYPLAWDFGPTTRTTAEEIVLRNASAVAAINGAGASFPAGTSINCSLEWVEE